ncbi:MAG: PAS domain S-box protein, partial [Thermodesulfobacteriota bacterium]
YENSSDGILIAELKSKRFKYANSAICRMLGYPMDELLTLSVDDIHPKRSLNRVLSEFTAMAKEKGRLAKNIICIRKDGSQVYADVFGTAKKVGTHTYVLGVFRDASDRKQMEDKLQQIRDEAEKKVMDQTEALEKRIRRLLKDRTKDSRPDRVLLGDGDKYRILIETMNEGLCIVDEDRIITFVNATFCRMLGYSSQETVGSLLDNYVSQSDRKILMEQHARRVQGGQVPYELTFVKSNGEEIITLISPKPVFDETKTYKGAFAVVTDISELKRKEKILAEREEELSAKTRNLEELNNALKALLQRRDEDRVEMEEKVILNVRRLIVPYLEKLKETGMNSRQLAFVRILEESLADIISPFSRTLSTKFVSFTGSEVKIANLIRQGKRTKEIARLLGISKRTVEAHRDHIRTKLGLKTSKGNLRTHLMSIQ